MTLVDTSVWVDHLRHGHDQLGALLERGDVSCHPFVIGELACGQLADRDGILRMLDELPAAPVAEHGEVLRLVRARQLHGRGLGWIDVHLLASALSGKSALWTLDKRLAEAARLVGLQMKPAAQRT